MKKNSIILIISFCIISITPIISFSHSGGGIITAFLFPSLYEDESAFTLIPASIGSIAFTIPAYILGGTVYVFGYALGHPFGKEKEISTTAGIYTGLGVLRLGGYTAGAPFYVLEKAFYDVPNALFFGNEPSQSNDKKPNNIAMHQKNTFKPDKNQEQPNKATTSKIIKIKSLDPLIIKCPPRIKIYFENGEKKIAIYSGNSGFQPYECIKREKAIAEQMKRITRH